MICQRKDRNFLDENIAKTMSCSHPKSGRFIKGESGKSMHCGTCLPCLIRKSSEYHAYKKLVTNYRYMPGDKKSEVRNSCQLHDVLLFLLNSMIIQIFI